MQKLLMDVVNNGLAQSGVAMLNLRNVVPASQGDSLTPALVDGVASTLGEYLVSYFQGQTVSFDDYERILDDVTFNALVSLMFRSDMVRPYIAQAYGMIGSLPIPDRAKEVVFRGVVQTAMRTMADTIDSSPSLSNTPLQYVAHPYSATKARLMNL